MARRDAEAILKSDRTFRDEEKSRRAAARGAKNPAATDWMRRDAREMTWQERTRKEWAREDNAGLDRLITLSSSNGEDDWRVDEFRDLLEREKGWRTKVYRWWLTVWDASAEDYLFDPADSDDYGFPKTRLDGRPWDYQPKKKKKRYLTSNGERRMLSASADDDDEFDEEDDMLYDDEDDEEELFENLDGWEARRVRPRSSTRSRFEVEDDEDVYDDDDEEEEVEVKKVKAADKAKKKKKKAVVKEVKKLEVKKHVAAAKEEEDDEEDEADIAEAAYAATKQRYDEEDEDLDDDLDEDDDDDEEEEWVPRRRSRTRSRRRTRVGSSRRVYVESRLRTLSERVAERVDELEDEEYELVERRRKAVAELKKVRKQIAESGEVVPKKGEEEGDEDLEVAVVSKGPRHRSKVLLQRCQQLSERRMGVWAALDEAEGRLEEIDIARKTLRVKGLRGLYTLIEGRRVSRSLRTFLEKIT